MRSPLEMNNGTKFLRDVKNPRVISLKKPAYCNIEHSRVSYLEMMACFSMYHIRVSSSG